MTIEEVNEKIDAFWEELSQLLIEGLSLSQTVHPSVFRRREVLRRKLRELLDCHEFFYTHEERKRMLDRFRELMEKM